MNPPIGSVTCRSMCKKFKIIEQVCYHQGFDEKSDKAGFIGQVFSQCFRAEDEAADEKISDADDYKHGKDCHDGGDKVI